MWWLALACSDGGRTRAEPPSSPSTPTTPTSPPGSSGAIDPWVAVPYAVVGEAVAVGRLRVRAGDDGAALEVGAPSGAFSLSAPGDPLGPGEVRDLDVRYTGPVDAPRIEVGSVRVSLGALRVDVGLAAVVGDLDLPDPDWVTDGLGTRATAPFPSAPFPYAGSAWDDPSVLVFVPAAFSDPGAVAAVTHLHGFGAELSSTVPRQGWVEQHAASGRDAVLIVPQGPVNASSGDFGRLEEDGGHERLVRDVLSVLYRDGLVERPAFGAQVVSSHSGGYAATASLLDHGGLPIDGVFLYDSLYGYVETFRAFADAGGVLFSNYTATGGTDGNNVALREALRSDGVPVSDLRMDHLLAGAAAIGATDRPHDLVMTDGRVHERWLRAGPLPRSPRAAPSLLAVRSDGATATVEWRAERLPAPGDVVVEGSEDGATWRALGRAASGTRLEVPAAPFVRLRGADAASSAYAGGGDDWLVVDGFHRITGGSWSAPTHDFAARVGAALGGASTAVDDAVAEGLVDLRDYDRVVWLLGDESTADVTFDDDARDALSAYVAGGGRLLVSGAELGFATDDGFLAELGVDYVADDAEADEAAGFAFGVVYPEDYPDVLSSETTLWRYPTGGGAAVGHDHQVIAVGFGLESMTDDTLGRALPELVGWLR